MEKLQADIFKLDNDLIDTDLTFEEYIQSIIDEHSDKGNLRYLPIDVKDEVETDAGFYIRLFISDNKEKPAPWLQFLNSFITEEESSKMLHLKSNYPSFLLFLFNDESIYAIAKGAGSSVIKDHILINFGLEVMERLIERNASDLRQADERGIFGSVIAQSRFFVPNHKIDDENTFGKFYKNIKAFISKDKLANELGLLTTKNSLVVGGENSLQIKTKNTIEEIIFRIQKIDQLLTAPMPPQHRRINTFRRLGIKELNRPFSGTTMFKYHLQTLLVQFVFNEYILDKDVEIYHPDIFKYLTADNLTFYHADDTSVNKDISCSERVTLKTVFELFNLTPSNEQDFFLALQSIYGYIVDEAQEYSYDSKNLLAWITGEVDTGTNKYFKYDDMWLQYEDSFVTNIDSSLDYLLKKMGKNEVFPVWNYDKEKERKYNLNFRGATYIVCDTALVNNIEICDFFKIDTANRTATFYHVKNGWGQSIRVLCNQIMNGAKQIRSIINNRNEPELLVWYNRIKGKNYVSRPDAPTFDQIKELFNCTNFEYHLIYGSKATSGRDPEILKSKSTIAKLSVLSCEGEIRSNYGMNFKISKVLIT